RRIQSRYLEDDQQKTQTVAQRANMTLADARGYWNRLIRHSVGAAKESHGDRRRVGKSIRQQVQEFLELVRAHHPKTRGQVDHVMPGHRCGYAIVQAIRQTTADARL